MTEPYRVATNSEVHDLWSRRRGFIFNAFTRTGATAGRDNVLHWVGCDQVPRMFEGADPARRPSVRKLFFDTAEGAHTRADIFGEPATKDVLYRHLEKQGYRVERNVRVNSGIIDAVATSGAERVVIEVKGEDRGGYSSAQMNFQMGIGQLASRMVDADSIYALGFPATSDYNAVLQTFRGSIAFERLKLRFYLVHLDGPVETVDAERIRPWIDQL